MLIGDQLREQKEDPSDILFKNLDLINKLYLDVMADNIEEEETGEESHSIICTMVAAHLLYNKTELESPIEYLEEDETLICNISERVICLLALERLVEKGKITRKMINGVPIYTGEKTNVKKKK